MFLPVSLRESLPREAGRGDTPESDLKGTHKLSRFQALRPRAVAYGLPVSWRPLRTALLTKSSQLIVQQRILSLIVVRGAGLFDFRRSLIQLGLAELDDGAQAQAVAPLR